MKASKRVAKLERQFEYGMITAEEYAHELRLVANAAGLDAIREFNKRCAYVITVITGDQTSVTYYRTEDERDAAYNEWNRSMTDVYDVILPDGDWLNTGMNYIKNVPSSLHSAVRCVVLYDVDCPCGECFQGQ